MAAIKFHLFRSIFDAEMHMLGAVKLGLPLKGAEVISGLHGLTLTFSSPAVTVTFSDPTGVGLQVAAILEQIGTAGGSLLDATLRDQSVFVFDAARTVATVINLAGSTAGSKLGLKTTGTLSGKKYAAADGAAPRFLSISDTGKMDAFVVTTEE